MPMCQEEEARFGEGATSDIGQCIIEEFLWVLQTGKGGDMEDEGNDGWRMVCFAKGRGVVQ
jgi:hypothetical protein